MTVGVTPEPPASVPVVTPAPVRTAGRGLPSPQGQRWSRWSRWWRRWAVPAGVAVFAATCAALFTAFPRRPQGWRAIDLAVYRVGARALLRGGDIYAVHPATSHLHFTYPPFAALWFTPLELPGFGVSLAAMTALSLAALLTAVALTLRAVRPEWTARTRWSVVFPVGAAALLAEPVRETLSFGQVNLVLMAMVLADLFAARTVLPRGVLTGLATAVKLTPGIFVVYLLLTRRFREAATAAATVAGTALLAAAVAPGPSLRYWTDLVFDAKRVGGVAYVSNQSLQGALDRLAGGLGASHPWWLLAAATTVTVGLCGAVRAARAGDALLGAVASAVTGLLVSPISWSHHWVWAVPAAAVLWERCAGPGRRGIRLLVAGAWTALFLLAPIWWVPYGADREYHHHGAQLLVGNAYLLAGIVLLAAATARPQPRQQGLPDPYPAVRQPSGSGATLERWHSPQP